jgi:hypothetical protein
MAKPPKFPSWLVLVLGIGILGCGTGRHVVKGRVTLDGQPVAEAAVMFVPAKGAPGQAQTDDDGNYILTCANEPGIPAGNYKVCISKFVVQSNKTPAADDLSPGKLGNVKHVVPERYGMPEKSGLTATVPGGTYDFALSSK